MGTEVGFKLVPDLPSRRPNFYLDTSERCDDDAMMPRDARLCFD